MSAQPVITALPAGAEHVIRGVRALAGVCDGAQSKDGQGYAGPDVSWGHALAALPESEWTAEDVRAAAGFILKYAGQLRAHGIDTAAVKALSADEDREAVRALARRAKRLHDDARSAALDGSDAVLAFPYNPDLVEALKDALPPAARRFDRDARSWRVAVDASTTGALAHFLAEHGFDVADALELVMTDPPKGSTGIHRPDVVTATESGYRLAFAYDPAMVEEIKHIPGRRFEKDTKTWMVPRTADAVTRLRAFLARYTSVQAGDDVHADMEAVLTRADVLAAASKSTDAEIRIEGLAGELRPFQRAGVAYALEARRTFIADEMGLGKGGLPWTRILTPTGWTTFGDVEVGQRVIGSDGKAHLVTGVYPRGELDVVRVTMSDGSSVVCDLDHLWQVQTVRGRFCDRFPQVLSTREIMAKDLFSGCQSVHFIPVVEPVELDDAGVRPLDPYFLGLLLGDGCFSGATTANYTSGDDELIDAACAAAPSGTHVVERPKRGNCRTIAFPSADRKTSTRNPLVDGLRELSLWGGKAATKFVPPPYLWAPTNVRLEMLRGLLDTDGSARADGIVEFTSVSPRLADDVTFLVQSLGGIVRRSEREPWYTNREGARVQGQRAYRVNITMPYDLNPFRLARKAVIWKPREKYAPARSIAKIEPAGRGEVTCIAVDASDCLYVTEDFIVTHNTMQALATCQAADAFPALIVCPASLRLNWQREANKWLPGRSTAVLSGKRPIAVPRADIVIINYDILDAWQELLVRTSWQAVVYDESHAIKSPKALRTKAAKAIAKDRPIVLCLSGTPMLSRPSELITQLQVLDRLGDLGGWYRFATRFCKAFKGRHGWDVSGASHLDELNDALRKNCYVRRLKKDVLTELPPKVHVEVPVEIDNRDEYARAATDVKRWLQGKVDSDQEFLESIAHLSTEAQARARGERRAEVDARARKAEELVRINALKRLSARGKLAAAKQWITDFLESGEKLLVFVHHTEIATALAREFKAPSIVGETSMEARQAAVDRFQSDPACRVIVLNLQAGGVGLTLTAASNVVFVELGWTPGGHDQAVDRCHRIGQHDSVTAWYLLGEDTIDRDIYALIEAKRAVVEAATDGGITIDEGSMLTELLTRIARTA